jgi:hypothetical protein
MRVALLRIGSRHVYSVLMRALPASLNYGSWCRRFDGFYNAPDEPWFTGPTMFPVKLLGFWTLQVCTSIRASESMCSAAWSCVTGVDRGCSPTQEKKTKTYREPRNTQEGYRPQHPLRGGTEGGEAASNTGLLNLSPKPLRG